MKKTYFFLMLLFSTTVLFSQNNDFTNSGGDLLWSNSANWSLGVIPTTANTGQVRLILNSESLVDQNFTIKKIQNTFGTTVNTPLGGNATLTIDPGATNAYGFENVSNFDVNMIFNGLVNVNNTGSGTTQTLMRNQNGNSNDTNTIVFGDGSTLTLTTNLELRAGSGGDNFNFNGTLAGSAALRIAANTTATFGSTSNNTGFTGSIVYIGNPGLVVVNAADDNVFMPSGQKIQVNATGGVVQLNGANVYQGNITVGGTNSFTMDLNKNQNSMGTIILSASGTLNLDVDNSVTEIAFADNSGSAWNAGTLNITGFKDGVIRFGTDSSGLTSAQLSQITVDDGSNGLALDSNGYLYSYDTSWTGAESQFWAIAGNWSHGVPGTTDDVYIADVANAPIIGGALQITVSDLIIDEPDAITLNSGGVLIVNGASTGNVKSIRNLATSNWYLVSSPISGQAYNDAFVTANNIDAGAGNNRGIATYTTSTNTWSYLQAGGAGTFNNGQGYSVKRAASGNITFTGTINTADVSVGVSNADNGFNLIGNPFTAHLNTANFLTDNTANLVSQTLWVWNQASSSYETKVTDDAFVLAPAQGFFVRSANGTNLNIAESYRASSGGTFQKTSRTEVKLMMNDGASDRFAKIYFLDNATKGFDNGFDGETFDGIENSVDIFTNLLADNDGKKFQVQSLPIDEMETMIVPVGVKAAGGKEITFTAETLNLPGETKVFLEDRLTNTITRLDEVNASYKVTLNDALNGTGRFFLHTKASGVLSTDEVTLQNTNVFATSNNNLRVVGLPSGNANLKMYNILGKQVLNTSFTANGAKEIALPKLATGVYLIQLETSAGKLNKKIVLE